MLQTPPKRVVLAELRSAVVGDIYAPGDPGYDAARTAWNLAVDQRPALVARARNAADVARIVRFAAEQNLRVAPQGVGHGAGRVGPLEQSVLLRTDLMRGVQIDVDRRTARVAAGALWSDLLEASAPHGLAGPAGSAPDVGVVALALGGGIGWLSRTHGLCCHSITAAELVTPALGPVRCDADHRPDLLWALRGGGGDIGVVTAIELALVPVPDLHGGSLLWPWERAGQVLHAWRRWTETVPETVTTAARLLQVPDVPDVPAPMRGRRFVTVSGVLLESPQTAASLLAPLRDLGPEIDMFAPVAPDALIHLHLEPEHPVPARAGHRLLTRLTPQAVEALVLAAGPGSGSTLLSVEIRHLGGAVTREAPGALARLDAEYLLLGIGMLASPADRASVEQQLERVLGTAAGCGARSEYLNFIDEPGQAARSLTVASLDELARCRALTDPAGVLQSV
jgi:FAD binding domain